MVISTHLHQVFEERASIACRTSCERRHCDGCLLPVRDSSGFFGLRALAQDSRATDAGACQSAGIVVAEGGAMKPGKSDDAARCLNLNPKTASRLPKLVTSASAISLGERYLSSPCQHGISVSSWQEFEWSRLSLGCALREPCVRT